ncbi:MAG: DNA-formamidopyrimidine glycosylase, partial [Woeseiaceae bacterium]|nr:DNA-formamidopyrimidine glycosylase [Woeseiaceae bacterium]
LLDQRFVVGVGNIYASESLFLAGINPKRAAGRVSLSRYQKLAAVIKDVLGKAIQAGGTTLRDFYSGDGEPGYFAQQLEVYGRDGEHCHYCNSMIGSIVQGQRSTFYCKQCQT